MINEYSERIFFDLNNKICSNKLEIIITKFKVDLYKYNMVELKLVLGKTQKNNQFSFVDGTPIFLGNSIATKFKYVYMNICIIYLVI